MNFSCGINKDFEVRFYESDVELNGKRSSALMIYFNTTDSINFWFDDDKERAKFIDALLAYQMDYQMLMDKTSKHTEGETKC